MHEDEIRDIWERIAELAKSIGIEAMRIDTVSSKVNGLEDDVKGIGTQSTWDHMGMHKKFRILADRVDDVDNRLCHFQAPGMLRVKELEIRDNMAERKSMIEAMKQKDQCIRDLKKELEVERKAVEALRDQPKINWIELESRLDSISQILFERMDKSKKRHLREGIETAAAAIRLLINDIQFPLVGKDIFKYAPPQSFMDRSLMDIVFRGDDDLDDDAEYNVDDIG